MTYVRTNWRDHIVDIETGQVIQEGTRFAAARMNNIEDGIEGAHAGIESLKEENTRLKIEIEMLGRVKDNNGSFFDPLDGNPAKALEKLTKSAISQLALSPGNTVIKLDSVPFAANDYLTIYDDEKTETVKVVSKTTTSITVGALANAYKKGAMVAASNSAVASEKMQFGHWGTFAVNISGVV